MARVAVLCSLLLAVHASAAPTALSYQVGQELEFAVTGSVGASGEPSSGSSGSSLGTSAGLLQGILAARCTQVNDSGFLFVFNMFNVQVSVSQSKSLSSVEGMKEVAAGSSLGADMYYFQDKTGQILEVWYDTKDSPYYVNVKLGALNAFQTHVLPAAQKLTVLESSPLGHHKSNYVGSHAPTVGSVISQKTFNQHDVLEFHDRSVSPNNLDFTATGAATINSAGQIEAASVDHLCVLKDATPNAAGTLSAASASSVGSADTTGFNINLSSRGTLTHQIQSNKMASAESSRFAVAKVSGSRVALEATSQYIRGNMLDVARTMHVQQTLENALAAAEEPVIAKALQQMVLLPHSQHRLAHQAMRTAMKGLKAMSAEKRASLLKPFMQRIDSLDRFARSRLLVTAAVSGEEALMVRFALASQTPSVALQALMACQYYEVTPSSQMLRAVASLAASSFEEVRTVAQHTLARLSGSTVRAVAGSAFPFNKTASKKASLGGKVLGVDFDGELFAGTNFNCNQPTFDFEARGDITGDVRFMGLEKQAFEASAVYGQEHGSALADEILVTVFGKTLYQKKFPTLACKGSTYDIAHSAPGFDLSYTVWVSIIPVTFQVGADLELDLKWQWEICAEQLTADIALLPSAGFTFTGGAVVDLLLLKAGVTLGAGLNSVVKPEAYITGSECEIGFNVTQTNSPMDADFQAYFAWKHCKFLIFDCHWGNHNTHTFWSWDAPSSTHQLLSESWKIKA